MTADAVYLAAARAYCLASFPYTPDAYPNDQARERHIAYDAESTAREPWLRAVVDAVAGTKETEQP